MFQGGEQQIPFSELEKKEIETEFLIKKMFNKVKCEPTLHRRKY